MLRLSPRLVRSPPQGGWQACVRPVVSGACFLCRLRPSVHRFPLWTALPSPRTPRGSDVRKALGAPREAASLGRPRTLSDLPSSRRFSPHIPRSSWTPADPRGPHPRGPSVLASGTFTPSPSAFRSYGAVSSFRECGLPVRCTQTGLPCGLCGSLCTLQLVRSGSHPSSPTATLGTGGWLGLTRQGLSPCKKRQASLGVLTFEVTRFARLLAQGPVDRRVRPRA